MAKHYDIYTQIPGIKPRTQVWVTPNDTLKIEDGFFKIKNIVGTTAKKLSNTKTIICRQEYFVCMVESRYGSEHHE